MQIKFSWRAESHDSAVEQYLRTWKNGRKGCTICITSGSKVLHVDRKHRHYFLRRKSNSDSRIVLVSYWSAKSVVCCIQQAHITRYWRTKRHANCWNLCFRSIFRRFHSGPRKYSSSRNPSFNWQQFPVSLASCSCGGLVML